LFQELFPIPSVADLPRSLGFYRDLLGCELTYRFPEHGEPVFVSLRLGPSTLGLGADPTTDDPTGGQRPRCGHLFELCVHAEDCDAAIERLRAHGVAVLDERADQPWGERMARVTDPAGNEVVVVARR